MDYFDYFEKRTKRIEKYFNDRNIDVDKLNDASLFISGGYLSIGDFESCYFVKFVVRRFKRDRSFDAARFFKNLEKLDDRFYELFDKISLNRFSTFETYERFWSDIYDDKIMRNFNENERNIIDRIIIDLSGGGFSFDDDETYVLKCYFSTKTEIEIENITKYFFKNDNDVYTSFLDAIDEYDNNDDFTFNDFKSKIDSSL